MGRARRKRELVEALRREEVNRGLTFEYCLITAGTSLNRAPSDQVWGEGDILSLDSGGNYKGYIGDLCRMAIQGEPDGELEDLLGEIDEIQHGGAQADPAGRQAAARSTPAPARCSKRRRTRIRSSSSRMGWASSATRRRGSRATGRCPIRPMTPTARLSRHGHLDRDDDRPPAARLHQARGHGRGDGPGWEAFGDRGRGWNRGGVAPRSSSRGRNRAIRAIGRSSVVRS